MTLSKKLVCNFAKIYRTALFKPLSKPLSKFLSNPLSMALLVMLLGASVSVAQTDRRDSESRSNFRAVDFPYQAIVGSNPASVYSGPDDVHYATDELPSGEIVVVYRHDPNGWCAIQPPAGSFSLLPEAAVEKLSDGIGVLIQDQVQAWVGTRLGSVDKPLWQVKLRSEEEVEIIGEASWPSPDGHSTIWYQIAPPAGEFRWVKMADLKVPGAASRRLPDDRNLVVDQRQARNAFTEVDIDDDSYVQQAAAYGDRKSNKTPRTKPQPDSGFVYRSEQSDSSAQNASDDPYASPKPPELDERADRTQRPTRDTEALNFHFRPIGKTARSASGGSRFDTKSKSATAVNLPSVAHAETKIDRINRAQNKVVQATFQSPRTQQRPELSAPGQWKAAANNISQRNRSSAAGENSKSPDSLLTRQPTAGSSRSGSRLSPWETTRGNERGPTTQDALSFQWDDREDLPLAQSAASVSRDFSLGDDQAVVGSAMFSKLSPQLAQLEMALTNEMLKRPNEWQLSDLELTVEQVYSQTQSPVERLQAQRILDKLKNCRKIRSGYAKSFQASGETFGTSLSSSLRADRTALNGSGGLAAARDRLGRFNPLGRFREARPYGLASTGLASTGLASTFGGTASTDVVQGMVGTGVDTNVESGALYDAHGWLTELVSEDRNNRPVYVLVNDEGKITHHIAPSPGLNLHRYLKSKVGVNGRQGYNNVLKLSHVTADAVSELIRR